MFGNDLFLSCHSIRNSYFPSLCIFIESRRVKQFLSSWDSSSSSETLIISETIYQKVHKALFKSSSLEIDKQLTNICLMLNLNTHLLTNTAQPNRYGFSSISGFDLLSSWRNASGMSAPINISMSSDLKFVCFKPFKWLTFHNSRYFWKWHVELLHWDNESTLHFKHLVVDNAGNFLMNFMYNDTLPLILCTSHINFGFVSMYVELCWNVFSYQSTLNPSVKKSTCLFPFFSWT